MADEKSTDKKLSRTFFYAVGRRKSAVARVRLFPSGKGDVEINGQPAEKFLSTVDQNEKVLAPFRLLEKRNAFDSSILVSGGGITAQAEAIRHGVARALALAEPETKTQLKQAGFLRRDPRQVERQKPGLKGARKKEQFSKR